MDITTREFLRNFKQLREQLKHGEIQEIRIIQKDGYALHVMGDTPKTCAQRFIEKIKKSKPIYIARPEEDIFEL